MALKEFIKEAIPSGEVILVTPKSTAQLETTTSLAEIPAISATTICQKPRPMGAKKGTSHLPSMAPKLDAISVEYPWGPKFKSTQIASVAMKIVVPAFSR